MDLKQVWFAGVHGDIGGAYPPDKNDIQASDTPLTWMLDEANAAGLITEPHIRNNLTDGARGHIHHSRKHVYRFKRPLDRNLQPEDAFTLLHPSVKARYERDDSYRPPYLKALVEKLGWQGLDVGK